MEVLINAEYEPVGHSRHCDLFSAEYEPETQPVHARDPVVALCSPGAHLVQLTFAPVHPVSHKQSVIVVLPTGETVFAGQPTQPECPVPVLYVPAAHATHGPPFSPFHPALHIQNVMLALLATEYEFAGHERHSDLSSAEYEPAIQDKQIAADMLEYSPAPQSAHFTDSWVGRYLPATHAVQLLCIPIDPALQMQNVMLTLMATEYEFAGHERHSDLSSAE